MLDMGGYNIGDATNPITLTVNPGSGTNAILQNVGTINGTGGITMNGAGILTLAGTNSYTGTTTITGGTLQVNNANALGSGNITFNGGTLQYTSASAGQDWSTRFKSSSGAINLDVNSQSVTLGSIDSSNTGGLAVFNSGAASGTAILAGNNSLSGMLSQTGAGSVVSLTGT